MNDSNSNIMDIRLDSIHSQTHKTEPSFDGGMSRHWWWCGNDKNIRMDHIITEWEKTKRKNGISKRRSIRCLANVGMSYSTPQPTSAWLIKLRGFGLEIKYNYQYVRIAICIYIKFNSNLSTSISSIITFHFALLDRSSLEHSVDHSVDWTSKYNGNDTTHIQCSFVVFNIWHRQ